MASETTKDCSVSCVDFGKLPDGQLVQLYTLRNANGVIAKVSTYGATLTELHVPDKRGKLDNVVLGFDNLAQYLDKHPHFGGTIGRYANRIAKATFALDGKEYKLLANNGPNTLHGGKVGFDKRLWKAECGHDSNEALVRLTYTSPDGEEGFPGTVKAEVNYELTNNNELAIQYRVTTDKATPLSMTNHSYFNLSGAGSKDILGHKLQMKASHYTPVDDKMIPTGEIAPVKGTAFDFTEQHTVGERIAQVGGYDHNFVLDAKDTDVITVTDDESGRIMKVATTLPGVQFYTSNWLDGTLTGNGGTYKKYGALCLETQLYPDSMHHDNFPNCILRPGEQWQSTTRYTFSH